MALDILVVGDIVRDTVILPILDDPKSTSHPQGADRTGPRRRYLRHSAIGGTALLAQTVCAALKPPSGTVPVKVLSYDNKNLEESRWPESLTVLELYANRAGAKPTGANLVYRIDKVVGWVQDDTPVAAPQDSRVPALTDLVTIHDSSADDAGRATQRLIVINDRDKGFREVDADDLSPLVAEGCQAHFIVSMDYPLEHALQKALWRLLSSSRHCQRSVVVLAASSLRQEGVNIREMASIERTVEHFLSHLERSNLLKQLCACGYLVVRFDDGGVLLVTNGAGTEPDKLTVEYLSCPFFDTDEELYPQRYGTLTGYRTIMMAALARGMASAICQRRSIGDGISNGIRLGVLLCKQHYRNGFGTHVDPGRRAGELNLLARPLGELFANCEAAAGKKGGEDGPNREAFVASLQLPPCQSQMAQWSRVDGFRARLRDDREFEYKLSKVVEEGLDAVAIADELADPGAMFPWFPSVRVLCPYAEFGKIKTVDRQEIDNLTSLSTVIQKYVEDHRWRKPLSIATFGPPGSGKSFTVKQLLQNVDRQRGQASLEYNVAQFSSVDDLTGAFHQAQDKALSEEVPLIIFDEFDAAFDGDLGWLKYFLAPMQDGKFKGRAGTYQVGRAIFVFAGGTARTFAEFCGRAEHGDAFRNAKGPDFVSRLRGYLDIGDINGGDAMSDLLLFRRAIVLRSLLEDKAATIMDQHTRKARIDPKIVGAFIKAREYRHGVRSMEAILEMARLERGRFVIASLPPRHQLGMHVEPDEFLSHLGG